jgi:hypothetical protein
MLFVLRVFVAALDKVATHVDNRKRQLTLAAKTSFSPSITALGSFWSFLLVNCRLQLKPASHSEEPE